MKNITFIILSVMIFLCVGCSNNQNSNDNNELDDGSKQSVVTGETELVDLEEPSKDLLEEITSEEETEETQVATEVDTTKSVETPAPQETKKEESSTTSTNNKQEDTKKSEEQTSAPVAKEAEPEEPTTPKVEETKTVSYDPYQVVSLATSKTKAGGKVSLPEELDRALANGEITKEFYAEWYPYDGAGYYSVFVETDLSQASTVSGRKLETVDGIASHIAGMLILETGPYFYIEYTGITTVGGNDFYEFRCYRA